MMFLSLKGKLKISRLACSQEKDQTSRRPQRAIIEQLNAFTCLYYYSLYTLDRWEWRPNEHPSLAWSPMQCLLLELIKLGHIVYVSYSISPPCNTCHVICIHSGCNSHVHSEYSSLWSLHLGSVQPSLINRYKVSLPGIASADEWVQQLQQHYAKVFAGSLGQTFLRQLEH